MRHFAERLDQRILSQTELDVCFETSTGVYTKVGTTKVSDLIKNQISTLVNKIDSMDFGNGDYAVKVHQFGLNNATVKFSSTHASREAQGKRLVASVRTSNGESNGNEIYCIVRGGKIATFCFVKSYTGFNNLAQKLRVDGIIKNLKNFKKR